MESVRGAPGGQYYNVPPNSADAKIDLSHAQEAYDHAVSNSRERHAEIGILTAKGAATFARLGKDEDYGAHRIGSVTKTFTTFLALKLCKEGVLPHGLQTKLGDIIKDRKILAKVFENPDFAAEMTLDQLLSHTSGLDIDDHSAVPDPENALQKAPQSLQERFLQETRKYQHIAKPGDGIGFYSNAGLAVAGWMMEAAYNSKNTKKLSFAEIMKQEIFEGVFKLAESKIAPGPSGDIIQSPAGDMTSSTADLLKVAIRLQEGTLDDDFGKGWQSTMLEARDIFKEHGIGCQANAAFIAHAGLNREKFGSEERDVTALVQLPLGPNQPGLVAMCDTTALGPKPQEQRFIRALEECAGISKPEERREEITYNPIPFCPPQGFLFHGNAYLVTDRDPFTNCETMSCSRNGMRHDLERNKQRPGYHDQYGKQWLFIEKEDGRKLIYSDYCLLNKAVVGVDLAAVQPDIATVQALTGVYQDAEKPKEHSTYTFTERNGCLYMQEDMDEESFPCLYIQDPDKSDGSWVVSNPTGRAIQIRFPENPDKEFLTITDIFSGVKQLPFQSKRIPKQ